ncbi:MAG: radical SAM family heme chaperone HemW [Verrucomicrobia bacterium]|nr:radical SAM family heme chaperone HemW [Verrucomicrobiota bacterium]
MKPRVETLYVHVPFCTHLCPYCDFPKERLGGNRMRDFLRGLRAEWAWARQEFEVIPRRILFGGGTPTALSPSLLQELLEIAPWGEADEWTVEANPDGFGSSKASMLAEAGVTRLSLGAQAFLPKDLAWLGRRHDRATIVSACKASRKAGIRDLNLDLIYGLPDQGPAEWQATLEEACALEPDHLSAYVITPEAGTELTAMIQRGEWHPDSENEAMLFLLTQRFLEAHGFTAYEISNFARPGRECRHHKSVWSGEDYLGLGPGAVSTIAGRRWRNVRDTSQYARSAETGPHPYHEDEEVCGDVERRTERILLGLRTNAGLEEEALSGHEECLSELVQKGWGRRLDGRFLLTARGRLRADAVAVMLI